jgi:hypothetical protein
VTADDHANTVRHEIDMLVAKIATNGTIVCSLCNASDVTDDDHRAGCPVLKLRAHLDTLEAQAQPDAFRAQHYADRMNEERQRAEAAEAKLKHAIEQWDAWQDDALEETKLRQDAEAERDHERRRHAEAVDAFTKRDREALAAEAERDDWKWRGDEAEHSLHHCRGLLDAAEAGRDEVRRKWHLDAADKAVQIGRLGRERDRLADALGQIADTDMAVTARTVREIQDYARAALAQTENTP